MEQKNKIKAAKENRPSGLSGIELFGRFEIFKIFVVSPDLKWLLSPLEPVPLLFQSHLNRQQFSILDVIILFCTGELLR